MIKNKQAEALPSSLTLQEFGKAMSQVDLSTVSPENRRLAIFDHLMRVMADTIEDGTKASEIRQARVNRVLGGRV